MPDYTAFFNSPPYAWDKTAKQSILRDCFAALKRLHETNCPAYAAMSRMQNPGNRFDSPADIPAVPVQMFKQYGLKSVPDDQLFKTMTSSGTTGQAVSRIFLDKETATLQAKALSRIMSDFLGPKRRSMLIIDTPTVLRDPRMFSARGAGILGMMNFGRNHTYALKEDLSADFETAYAFLKTHQEEPLLIFGFTFMIWRGLYQAFRQRGMDLPLKDAVLIHAGGWKKMQEYAVDNTTFKKSLREVFGPDFRIHNFYGMVEQTGSVYVECEAGHFHVSNFSEMIVRDPLTLDVLPFRTTGVIETMSVLPLSYPGFAILTEDMGEILGEDDCPCGRKGKYFEFRGRIPKAEMRGCSDVYSLGK